MESASVEAGTLGCPGYKLMSRRSRLVTIVAIGGVYGDAAGATEAGQSQRPTSMDVNTAGKVFPGRQD